MRYVAKPKPVWIVSSYEEEGAPGVYVERKDQLGDTRRLLFTSQGEGPRREHSLVTLGLDSRLPVLSERNSMLFKPPIPRYCVIGSLEATIIHVYSSTFVWVTAILAFIKASYFSIILNTPYCSRMRVFQFLDFLRNKIVYLLCHMLWPKTRS